MTNQPLAIQLAKSIRLFGLNAFSASMAVTGAEKKLNERMWSPKIGDLVFEMTTAHRCKDDNEHVNAVGYLLSEGEEADENGNNEDVYRILTLDGREMRWTNAEFLALPEERIKAFDRQAPTSNIGSQRPQSTSTEKRYISGAEDMLFDIEEQDRLDAGILTNVKRDSINLMREFQDIGTDDEERVIYLAKNYRLSCDDVRRALADGPNYDREKCRKETEEARKSSLPREFLSFERMEPEPKAESAEDRY